MDGKQHPSSEDEAAYVPPWLQPTPDIIFVEKIDMHS